MYLFKKVADLQQFISQQKKKGKTVGFVPTMGALHRGHLELVLMANQTCEVSVVSIFVNPSQFNDPLDLERYPRTPGKDMAMLEEARCTAVFMPTVEEVYPPGLDVSLSIRFGHLIEVMEGKFRPGHFEGMSTVVHRLLQVVQPHRLFMGQKDFQQFSIVKDMLRQMKSAIELIMCPTVREGDGLAMSSRNVRLTPEMRAIAPQIYQVLQWARVNFRHLPAAEIQALAIEKLNSAGLRTEYFEIVEGNTLLPVEKFDAHTWTVACVAAYAGEVRLIDNLELHIPEKPA